MILITGVVFVSCAKDENPTATETLTEETGAGEENTTTTTKEAFVAPTFKTQAAISTTKANTPVKWPTTTTTTKASTTTTTTTKATTTTTPKHTSSLTTTTAAPGGNNPIISTDKNWSDDALVKLPEQPIASAFGTTSLLDSIISWLK